MKLTVYMLVLLLWYPQVSGQSIDNGLASYQSKDWKAAKKSFSAISSKSPDYSEAQFYLGRIAFNEKDYKSAIKFFEEATKKVENNAEYYTWLGNAYGMRVDEVNKLSQGMIAPKIKNNYEKAVSIDPKNMDANWGLIEYYTQAPSFMGGSFEKALETAQSIGTFNPKEGYRANYTIYHRQGETLLALEAMEKLAELDSAYRFNLGLYYHVANQYDNAYDLFKMMISEDSTNVGVLYQIGRTSALSGMHVDEGIDALRKYVASPVIEGNPSHSAANMRLGMIYEKTGDFKKAQEYYVLSLEQDPDMTLAQEGLERIKK